MAIAGFVFLSAGGGLLILSRCGGLLEASEIWLAGIPFGLLVSTLSIYAVSFVLGFGPGAIWSGAAAFFVLAAFCGAEEARTALMGSHFNRPPVPHLALGLAAAALLIYLHAGMLQISAAGWRTAGSSSTDLPFHAAVAATLAHTRVFPPQHPFYAGGPLGYHVIADVLSASLVVLGSSLTRALVVPDTLFSLCLCGLVWALARRCGLGPGGAALSLLLITCGGGFGFFEFLLEHPHDAVAAFGVLERPFDSWPERHLYWSNLVRDFLLHTRTTGPALCLAMTAFLLLAATVATNRPRRWGGIAAGICLGLLPAVNVHVFVGATCTALLWIAVARRRELLWLLASGLPVAALLLAYLHASSPAVAGAMRLTPAGWMEEGILRLPWFWVRNVGMVIVLWPLGIRGMALPGRQLALASTACFVLGNAFVLTSAWANQKLMLPWFVVAAVAAAAALERAAPRRVAGAAVAAVLVVACVATGVGGLIFNLTHSFVLCDVDQMRIGEYLARGAGGAVACADGDAFAATCVGGVPAYVAQPPTLAAHGLDPVKRAWIRDGVLGGSGDLVWAAAREPIRYVLTGRDPDPRMERRRRVLFRSAGWSVVLQTDFRVLYRTAY